MVGSRFLKANHPGAPCTRSRLHPPGHQHHALITSTVRSVPLEADTERKICLNLTPAPKGCLRNLLSLERFSIDRLRKTGEAQVALVKPISKAIEE